MNTFSVIKSECSKKDFESLTFLQRKVLTRLDIEFGHKNPDIDFHVYCNEITYSFSFSNRILSVNHTFKTKKELFAKIETFRDSIKYLECDFQSTNFAF